MESAFLDGRKREKRKGRIDMVKKVLIKRRMYSMRNHEDYRKEL